MSALEDWCVAFGFSRESYSNVEISIVILQKLPPSSCFKKSECECEFVANVVHRACMRHAMTERAREEARLAAEVGRLQSMVEGQQVYDREA
jgi:hypothetical protein